MGHSRVPSSKTGSSVKSPWKPRRLGPRLISLRYGICHFKSQGFRQSKPHMEQQEADSEGWGLVRLAIFRHRNLLGIPRILNPKGSLGLLSLPSSQVHLFFKLQESKAALEQKLCGVFPFQKLAWNSAYSRKSQLHGFCPWLGLSLFPLPSGMPGEFQLSVSTSTPKLPVLGLHARQIFWSINICLFPTLPSSAGLTVVPVLQDLWLSDGL